MFCFLKGDRETVFFFSSFVSLEIWYYKIMLALSMYYQRIQFFCFFTVTLRCHIENCHVFSGLLYTKMEGSISTKQEGFRRDLVIISISITQVHDNDCNFVQCVYWFLSKFLQPHPNPTVPQPYPPSCVVLNFASLCSNKACL